MVTVADIHTIDRLAAVVKRARVETGLTQADLAKLAGVSRQFVIEVEAGHPRAEIAKVFQVLGALGRTAQVSQPDVAGTPRPVRRDRKFFVSLALHRAVLGRLRADPNEVVRRGIAGLEARRAHARGSAVAMLDDWHRVLLGPDFRALEALLTADDEYSVEMRNLTPFIDVLSDTERQAALDQVFDERRWEQ
ncbi:helix-turn-helix domain-containing protein [Leucobacter albus]|uniref:Helix-turn-helix domain-containing protein n=1 Tax=Leucobacter albus TaxID=272210 RepID=A0ABW3TUU1_9MICO